MTSFCAPQVHQVTIMGAHLISSEGERPKEIEFCNNAQHLAVFRDWESIEVVLLKQRFQFAPRDSTGHRLHGARHILTDHAFEKAVHY